VLADIIPQSSDRFDWLTLGVRKVPIDLAQAGNEGACLAASHSDEERCLAREVCCQVLRSHCVEVEANLLHDLYHFWVDSLTRLRPGGNCPGLAWITNPIEPRCGHLRPPCIVHTCKQNGVHGISLFPVHRAERRYPVRQQSGQAQAIEKEEWPQFPP